ncbi:MAG: DUF839 domain-containing protein [Thermomicrobiales bacterium]|nr:MAG: DUF839 domain-containing protein [Thermomicrobiales bacterium]
MKSQRSHAPGSLRVVAALGAIILLAAVPTGAAAHHNGFRTTSPAFVSLEKGIRGSVIPLVNSGEKIRGEVFEGLPDGIGVAPAHPDRVTPSSHPRYVDLYVAHEQSHVPFGLTATSVFADFQDSSVSRVRVDTNSKRIKNLTVALSPDLGFIRFCSATMVGPNEGFANYKFLVNEESNDVIPVPGGAPYGSDPGTGAGLRQAGYSAVLNTQTGHVGVLEGAGRMNHENLVVVPGWRSGVFGLTGDDTFTSPSTVDRPNLSQMYMYSAGSNRRFLGGDGHLWAFRVTRTNAGAVDPADPQNDANDFFEINVGDNWKGEFIRVPDAVAEGTTGDKPQDALEDWSNANNVFQFIRIEDIAYDPDHPRKVYFTDTGNSRLLEDPGTGRLYRAPSGTAGTSSSSSRVFKMVMSKNDPTRVKVFKVLTEASDLGMRSPDNIAVGRKSIMVQEDTSSYSKIWRYDLRAKTWTHVATATQEPAETSGIVDVSRWFGSGWWALDVQSHTDQKVGMSYLTWTGPTPPGGDQYRLHRENGQLLLMHLPGS